MLQNTILLKIIFLSFMFILGAVFGSFACCQAWRIYHREHKEKNLGKWSVCLSCGKRLKPQENIPIISWILQKGKCKKCGAKIGVAEILSEVGLGLCFLLAGASFWQIFASRFGSTVAPLSSASSSSIAILLTVASFLVVLAILVIMWTLLVYDAKWRLLPTKLLAIVNVLAVIYLGLQIAGLSLGNSFWQDFTKMLPSLGIGVAILPGMYYLLYKMSGEKLVGGGDWLLALAVSLVLGNWWLCLLTLFLSNFMASIAGIVLKLRRGEKAIPFGPFLILAFVIIYALQGYLEIAFAGLV